MDVIYMKHEVRCLDKNEAIWGTLIDLHDDGEFIKAVFEFREQVAIEHHVTSDVGRALRERLTGDMVGRRVAVYYYGEGDEPVRVAVRDGEGTVGTATEGGGT